MRRGNRTARVSPQRDVDWLEDVTWVTRYQENRLVAMVKDFQCLYVYWELAEERKRLLTEHFGCEIGHLPLFLRVCDVTDLYFNGYDAHDIREIPVSWEADNWYIHQLQSGRNYFVDLGTKTIHGRFFALLRSNLVQLPPRPPGGRLDPQVRFARAGQPDETPPPTHDPFSSTPVKDVWSHSFTGYSLITSVQKGEFT
jgi:hypothetical protein